MNSKNKVMEAVPAGQVDNAFLDRVERYQGKKFQRIGMFNPVLLREVAGRMIEGDFSGEVEVLFTAENKMHDDTTSSLLIFKSNGGKNIFALAGLTDHTQEHSMTAQQEPIQKIDGSGIYWKVSGTYRGGI